MRRSRTITLGITLTLAATLLGGCDHDDDDCEDESLRQVRLVNSDGAVALQQVAQVSTLPASGGFGTHLADCGG